MASSWKNFGSILWLWSKARKERSLLRPASSRSDSANQTSFFSLVGGFKPRWKAVKPHEQDFHPEGWTTYWSPQWMWPLAAQNTLLAAESLWLWWSDYRHVALLFRRSLRTFRLPDYTYPVLGLPRSTQPATCSETTLAIGAGCFLKKNTKNKTISCDCLWQGSGRLRWSAVTDSWSERLAAQFGQPEQEETKTTRKHKLLWNEERRSWTEISPSLEKKEEIMALPTIATVGRPNVGKSTL